MGAAEDEPVGDLDTILGKKLTIHEPISDRTHSSRKWSRGALDHLPHLRLNRNRVCFGVEWLQASLHGLMEEVPRVRPGQVGRSEYVDRVSAIDEEFNGS